MSQELAAPPRVSVIVPAYNAGDFLVRALDSALAQTMASLEVVVIDDSSDDATLKLARKVAVRDSRVQVLHNVQNRGPSASRNRAIDVARGKWIALLDADDVWSTERLEQMLRVAEDADIVSDDQYIVRNSFLYRGGFKSMSLLLRRGFPLTAPCWLSTSDLIKYDLGTLKPIIRRSFFQQHGLRYTPNLHRSEDFHLYFEILAASARWLQLPDAYYFTYQHTGNISGNTPRLAREIIKSTEILLDHPAVAVDATMVALLQRRAREWESNAAFSIVWDLLRWRRGTELVRLLFSRPSYLYWAAVKMLRALYGRILWRIRKSRGGTGWWPHVRK